MNTTTKHALEIVGFVVIVALILEMQVAVRRQVVSGEPLASSASLSRSPAPVLVTASEYLEHDCNPSGAGKAVREESVAAPAVHGSGASSVHRHRSHHLSGKTVCSPQLRVLVAGRHDAVTVALVSVIAERMAFSSKARISLASDQAKFHFLYGLRVTPAELPAASAGVHTSSGRF